MKFGVFTVCLPEYGIAETVKVLQEIGYDGVEWRVAAAAPAAKPADIRYEQRYWSNNLSTLALPEIDCQAEKAASLCAAAGLEIYSLTTYLEVSDLAAIEQVLQAARKIKCPNIRINVPKYDGTKPYPRLCDETVRATAALEALAARYGVRINFEIHMGNIIPSASAAFRFVSHFDPKHIGIIFDPGNMVHEGFENYRLGLELLGPYLACVHVKNAQWQRESAPGAAPEVWKPVWAPLQKGYADLPQLVRLLQDLDYQGYLSLEDFSNEDETYPKLQKNLAYLSKLAQNKDQI